MKSSFIGLYEIEKFGINKLIKSLKQYGFDKIYLDYEVFFYLPEFKDFTVLLWVHNLRTKYDTVLDVLSCFSFNGVLLDGIRCIDDHFGVKGVLESINISILVKKYSERLNELGMELEVCFKSEEYNKLFNRRIGLLSRLRKKIGVLIEKI